MDDLIEVGARQIRGGFLVTTVHDLTRVTNPKTADIVALDSSTFVVVPVAAENPVALKSTFGEAMEHIAAYIGRDE